MNKITNGDNMKIEYSEGFTGVLQVHNLDINSGQEISRLAKFPDAKMAIS